MDIGTLAQWGSFVAAGAALAVSLLALRTNREALRATYRPVVRPVPLKASGKEISTAGFLLKNYGKGPAVGLGLFTDTATFNSEGPITTVNVVEPLGAGREEAERQGRVEVKLWPAASLAIGKRYRLLYQDIGGAFHETQFTVEATSFVVRFIGRHSQWKVQERIPVSALELAAVVSPEIPNDPLA